MTDDAKRKIAESMRAENRERSMSKERRIQRLTITGELLVDFLRMDGSLTVKFKGMPDDAKIVCVANDSLRGRPEDVVLFIESDCFDYVAEGEEYPPFMLECSAVQPVWPITIGRN